MKMKKLLISLALLIGATGAYADQKYAGHTPSSVAISSYTTSTNDKIVYLYNVGQAKFLDKGGIWGTQTFLNNGLPLTLSNNSGSYYLRTSSSNYVGMIPGNSTQSTDYYKLFIDQSTANANCSFTFTAVDEETAGVKNAYTIRTTYYSTSYYLTCNGDTIVTTTTAPTSADGYWIIVTKQDLLDEFTTAEGASATAVECSFVIDDSDFGRGASDVSSWKQSTGTSMSNGTTVRRPSTSDPIYYYKGTHGSGYNSYAHDSYSFADLGNSFSIKCGDSQHTSTNTTLYKNSTTYSSSTTYYIGNGYGGDTKVSYDDNSTTDKYDAILHAQRMFGGDWTGNIHGASGKMYQTKTVTLKAGRYMIKAEGFSNDGTGKLFAQVGSATSGDGYQEIAFETVADQPETYVQAAKLLNGGGFEKNVVVNVEKTGTTLTFGVVVSNGTSTSWTCFDNFSLQYFGASEINLILDEDQMSAEYINTQVNKEKNQTLYLKRSLKANQWNSIVLPVNLTSGQIKGAFGGDQVKVSKLARTEKEGKQIIFEPVNMNSNSQAIVAGEVYIIKPVSAMPTGLDEVTSTTVKDLKLSGSYYTINQVTLNTKVAEDGQVVPTDVVGSTEDNGLKHCGSYVTVDKTNAENEYAIPAQTYILSGGKWYYNTVGVNKVKGFRGWIATNQSTTDAGKTNFVINGVSDDVTAIEGITAEPTILNRTIDGVYTLGGQKVRDGQDLTGLAKGIYIVGGKKQVVK